MRFPSLVRRGIVPLLAFAAGCIIQKEMVPFAGDGGGDVDTGQGPAPDCLDCTSSCGAGQPYCSSPNTQGTPPNGRSGLRNCDPSRITAADLAAGSSPTAPIVWDGAATTSGAVDARSNDWIRLAVAPSFVTVTLDYNLPYDGVVLAVYAQPDPASQPLAASWNPGWIPLSFAMPPSGVAYLRVRNNANAAICYDLIPGG